jgi:hypothetical protein
MEAPEIQDVQQLLDRFTDLHTKVVAMGTPGQAVLDVVDPSFQSIRQQLRLDPTGQLDPLTWQELTEDARASLRQRIITMNAILERTVDEAIGEPTDPSNIMYRSYASNFWVVGLTVLRMLLTFSVLLVVFYYWTEATRVDLQAQPPIQPTEQHVLRMVILMGALGGCLHWTSSLAMYIGNGAFLRRWIPYYVLMPFEGAALATVIYLLLRVGVLSPSAVSSGPGNLNLLSLYAFAGLTGLFAKQAMQMLADVFSVIFAKIRAKDSAESAQATQPSASGPAPSRATSTGQHV